MKLYKNWYFPDNEVHFIEYFKNLAQEYQELQRYSSFKFLDKKRNAIDIGANVGLWSKDICKIFRHAILFEPFQENVECLKKNLEKFDNFEILNVALSNFQGNTKLYFDERSLGESTIRKHNVSNFTKSLPVQVKMLDDYSFREIDYIKIDVQFHELEVIEGAINTLQNNNPVLCIESARRDMEELRYVKKFVKILNKIGYRVVGESGKELFFKK
jgi:FkbM family methyltransferase